MPCFVYLGDGRHRKTQAAVLPVSSSLRFCAVLAPAYWMVPLCSGRVPSHVFPHDICLNALTDTLRSVCHEYTLKLVIRVHSHTSCCSCKTDSCRAQQGSSQHLWGELPSQEEQETIPQWIRQVMVTWDPGTTLRDSKYTLLSTGNSTQLWVIFSPIRLTVIVGISKGCCILDLEWMSLLVVIKTQLFHKSTYHCSHF